MANNTEVLAKNLRSLIIELDKLTDIYNELYNEQVNYEFDESEQPNHPVFKFYKALCRVDFVVLDVVNDLLREDISSDGLRNSLQKLSTIDALKDGNTEFVEYVKRVC
jgi:hypothetical protein